MITQQQLKDLVSQFKINEVIVLREFFQVWFLSQLYKQKGSEHLFFKGGTAIRLIFEGSRFSEDLDFTSQISEEECEKIILKAVAETEKTMNIELKKLKSIAGLSYRLACSSDLLPQPIYIRLDVSFREQILDPQKTIIKTNYPIPFNEFVSHPSKQEIMAEKIRAFMNRVKGRDLYDLWFLLQFGATVDKDLVAEKLQYYQMKYEPRVVWQRLDAFPKQLFVADLRPFVSIGERPKLDYFFDYTKVFIKTKIV